MNEARSFNLGTRMIAAAVATSVSLLLAASASAQLNLGPVNGDFSAGAANWSADFTGGTAGNVVLPNTNNVLITSDGTGSAEFNSDIFWLGPAAGGGLSGTQTVTLSFEYAILGPVTTGNNVQVSLRTFGTQNTCHSHWFQRQPDQQQRWCRRRGWLLTFTVNYLPNPAANYADIFVSMNVLSTTPGVADAWTNGAVVFNNFTVTTVPEPSSAALFGLVGLAGLGLLGRRALRPRAQD